mgnify:CR=1 FL=1
MRSAHALNNFLLRVAVIAAGFAMELMREGAMQTVLSGIISAFAWPATLVAAADFIDSTWSVAIDRCFPPLFRSLLSFLN